jgi:hypothetical protein
MLRELGGQRATDAAATPGDDGYLMGNFHNN